MMKKRKLKIKDIEQNQKLLEFCTKVINISTMLNNDEIRYLYLVSLISSDNLVDVESCDNSIEHQKFLIDNIDLFNIDDKIRKEVLKYAKKGLLIAKRDRKMFLNNKSC
jgi:hypothetical protein